MLKNKKLENQARVRKPFLDRQTKKCKLKNKVND